MAIMYSLSIVIAHDVDSCFKFEVIFRIFFSTTVITELKKVEFSTCLMTPVVRTVSVKIMLLSSLCRHGCSHFVYYLLLLFCTPLFRDDSRFVFLLSTGESQKLANPTTWLQ